MSIIKKLASQSVWYGLSTMVGRFLNYLLTPLLTYTFLPPEYGIISYIYAIISFANILFTYGMETTYFYFGKQQNEKKIFDNTFSMMLLSTVIFSSAIVLFRNPIQHLFKIDFGAHYIIMMAALLFFDTLSVIPFAHLRSTGKAKKFAYIKLTGIITTVLLTLFFIKVIPGWYQSSNSILHNFSALIYSPPLTVSVVFIANIIGSIVVLLFLYKEFAQVKLGIDKALTKQMLWYSLPLLLAGFAGMINETLDRIILTYLAEPASSAMHQQGVYGAVYKISILMTIFIQTFRYAAEPLFFAQSNASNSKENFARVMKYFAITCLFIFLFVILNMSWIKYFVGKNYWEGLHVVPILLAANLCLGIYLNQSMWYKLSGQTKFGAYISMAGAVITIVLNIILIPQIGYTGAAITTFITYASMMIISYIMSLKYYPINYDLKTMGVFLLLTIAIYAASVFIQSQNIASNGVILAVNELMLGLFLFVVYRREVRGHWSL